MKRMDGGDERSCSMETSSGAAETNSINVFTNRTQNKSSLTGSCLQLLAIRRSMWSITTEPIRIWSSIKRKPPRRLLQAFGPSGICSGISATCHPIIEPKIQKQ
ncbi:hypothetical protein fugu_013694 [Takifugu bimaculatus]|uniref:Uncharacterized protein n=1 Tax=Takifugu bimaculatus TaxID=433685 RepID=A0A4Z2C502_9TELE|nr:hypothetical protein fugu_013694 [Takifugu bimaculatus]